MSENIRPREVLATLNQLWFGKRCPHESECACRKGHWCPEAKATSDERRYPMMHLAGCSFAYNRCCCRVLDEIDALATKYLEHSGVNDPPVPIDVIKFFDPQRSIEVRDLPLKRYLGATWLVDEEWVVYLDASAPSEVRHFTAFHEGFHIICGSSELAFKRTGDTRQAVCERLADYFAASILLPRDFVYRLWPKVVDSRRMADIFSVPQLVMKSWLERLGIVPLSTL